MNEFDRRIMASTGKELASEGISVLQVNVGLRCNQSCLHCHLDASPARSEEMEWPTMERVLEVFSAVRPGLVDITGGAPELNPNLRRFVERLGDAGAAVQARTNLSALLESSCADLPAFFRDRGVRLVASLPCHLEEDVDAQRGAGTYAKSIEALGRLNALGYGRRPELELALVYNPGGPFLPPPQRDLEAEYRAELGARFGISFTRLITIANMPVGRFLAELVERDEEAKYRRLLRDSFNAATIDKLMCRHQICVGWDGTLYDCDFNYALGLPVDHGLPKHISRFDPTLFARRRIATSEICFGCTAGCGSSCGGQLV